MQRLWNVIQGTLVTGASLAVMGLVANQYVGQKPVAVNEVSQISDEATKAGSVSQKSDEAIYQQEGKGYQHADNPIQPTESKAEKSVRQNSDEQPVSQKSDKPADHNIVVVDVPIPEGRFRGVTQSVNVRGGRVVGLQVKFEKMD